MKNFPFKEFIDTLILLAVAASFGYYIGQSKIYREARNEGHFKLFDKRFDVMIEQTWRASK